MKSNLLVLQARLGSSRLPGKVLREILGRPLIFYQIDRILTSKLLNDLVVAIPSGSQDDSLAKRLQKEGIAVHRGDEKDVFTRFKGALSKYSADVIIRSTADCPLFMSEILDEMLRTFDQYEVDYLSNCLLPTYPDGLDIEIFKSDSFKILDDFELSSKQREHVTLAFYDGSRNFKTMNFANSHDLSGHRWTVDYIEDFVFIESIFKNLSPVASFSEVLNFLENHPNIVNQKSGAFRNVSLRED